MDQAPVAGKCLSALCDEALTLGDLVTQERSVTLALEPEIIELVGCAPEFRHEAAALGIIVVEHRLDHPGQISRPADVLPRNQRDRGTYGAIRQREDCPGHVRCIGEHIRRQDKYRSMSMLRAMRVLTQPGSETGEAGDVYPTRARGFGKPRPRQLLRIAEAFMCQIEVAETFAATGFVTF